jgi:hypothetical protein
MSIEDKKVAVVVNRETRVINRNFISAEYGNAWTKMQHYLFIEFYNVVKNFYMSKDDAYITSFTSDSITIKFPIDLLDNGLFDKSNRSKQLTAAADGLTDKKIRIVEVGKDGQTGFDFINMFIRIYYDPKVDRNHIVVKMPSEIYDEMMPIKSYAQLDHKLLGSFKAGNTIGVYRILKFHAFRGSFTLTFSSLRRQLGFFKADIYPEWKHFNSKVLKPAVAEINKMKEFDIEVRYSKARGSDNVEFVIVQHHKPKPESYVILDLNEKINRIERKPNVIQLKYLDTLINNVNEKELFSNTTELREWIISDIINQQSKVESFDWKHFCNAIAKQLKQGKYSEPLAHSHLINTIKKED